MGTLAVRSDGPILANKPSHSLRGSPAVPTSRHLIVLVQSLLPREVSWNGGITSPRFPAIWSASTPNREYESFNVSQNILVIFAGTSQGYSAFLDMNSGQAGNRARLLSEIFIVQSNSLR